MKFQFPNIALIDIFTKKINFGNVLNVFL